MARGRSRGHRHVIERDGVVGVCRSAIPRGGATELTLATAAAVAVSLAMALVMRQGGIVAEDADYDDKYEAAAEKARAAAGEKARAAAAKGGEGTLGGYD